MIKTSQNNNITLLQLQLLLIKKVKHMVALTRLQTLSTESTAEMKAVYPRVYEMMKMNVCHELLDELSHCSFSRLGHRLLPNMHLQLPII